MLRSPAILPPLTCNFHMNLPIILLLSKFVLAPEENVHLSQRRFNAVPRAFSLDRPLLVFSHFGPPPHLYAQSRIVAAPKAGARFSCFAFIFFLPWLHRSSCLHMSNFNTYLASIVLLSKFVLAPAENEHLSQRRFKAVFTLSIIP